MQLIMQVELKVISSLVYHIRDIQVFLQVDDYLSYKKMIFIHPASPTRASTTWSVREYSILKIGPFIQVRFFLGSLPD